MRRHCHSDARIVTPLVRIAGLCFCHPVHSRWFQVANLMVVVMLPAGKTERRQKVVMAISYTVKAPRLIAALAAKLDKGRWI